MKQNRNMLGIVFYEQTIAVSEVENSGGSIHVRRSAQFHLPDGMTLENVASVQTQFGAFLKEQGFKVRKAAVGISAKHILSTLLKVPPIQDAQTRHETIKIHLERKLQMELSEIVFDYWNSTNKQSNTTLALTALRTTIAGIRSLLAGLKITPLWLTGTSCGIDFVTSPGLDCNMIEYPHSVEVFIFESRALKAVLTIPKESSGEFNSELANKIIRQVNRTLWSVSEKKEEELNFYWWTNHPQTTAAAGGVHKILGNLKQLEVKGDKTSVAGNLCDFAVQLVGKMLSAEAPPINFLNGHHQEKKLIMTRQRLSRIAASAAVVIVLIGLYFYGWYSDRTMIVQYQQQLDSMAESVQAARQMIDQVGYARQWFQQQPVHLERLRELTLAFPRSSDIWLTSLAVDESLNQIITGRATTEEAILDVVDTLKSNSLFGDIKLLYIRKMGKETNIMTFAINFHARGER